MISKIIGLFKHIFKNIRNINKIKNIKIGHIGEQIIKFSISILVLFLILLLIGLAIYFLGVFSSSLLVFVIGYLLNYRPHLYIYYDVQDKLVYLCNDGITAAKDIEYKCHLIHHLAPKEKFIINDNDIHGDVEIKYGCVVTKRKFVDIINVIRADYCKQFNGSYYAVPKDKTDRDKTILAIIKQEFNAIYKILKS